MGGRIFTGLVLVVGLGIVAVPAGLVASALSKAREMEAAESGGDWLCEGSGSMAHSGNRT